MTRGSLRIYLGAAPGVGKTVKMLQEARRRQHRGTDVVVGIVETHGRAYTAEELEGLEIVPQRQIQRAGTTLYELDVDAVLRRRPDVVLIDELAHRNLTGPHERRWQDIDQLLDAGIDVLSTVNVQHLESLNDAVFQITGVRQQETVPDAVVRAADQIELVDMTPEALRRRLAHGHVYPAERVDAALANYFRGGNLSALRELALLWTADRVDEALARYRDDHDIESIWPVRERVVVALTGGPEQETLLRRGARIAGRGAGGELYAVQVVADSGLRDVRPESAAATRQLVTELGGTMHTVTGSDVGEAILEFARGVNASEIIIGASRRTRLQRILGRGVGDTVVDGSGDIDVLMVTHDLARGGRRPAITSWVGVGPRRAIAGWLLSTIGLALLTLVLAVTKQWHTLPLEVLIYLAFTVVTAIVGGIWPALTTAVLASLLLNWFFAAPTGTLTINQPQNVAALLVFLVVAASVASVVHLSARRTAQAVAAEYDSRVLAELTHSLLAVKDPLPELLDQARDIFATSGAAIVRTTHTGVPGQLLVVSGEVPLADLDARLSRVPVDETHQLVLEGDVVDASQQRLMEAYASVAAAILRRNELERQAATAAGLAKDNRSRAALLAAVSHDLRTPLAAIKAGVSSLRSTDIRLTEADQRELLETVENATDRLDGLIENLLDMSRIQSGSITARTEEVLVADIIALTLHALSAPERVHVWLPDPEVGCMADLGLAERVLANLVENALRYSPGRQEVVVTAERLGRWVELRVVDRGPGVPESERTGIFAPFQRYGDSPRGTGVGLGLAVAKGLTEAMEGTLEAEDTPGGGLTMCVRLPVAVVTEPAEGTPR